MNHPHYQLRPGKTSLYRRRVKHDTNGSTEGPRGEGAGELGADDAGVACIRLLATEPLLHVLEDSSDGFVDSPCGLVTLPQMTRILVPRFSV